jgi:imidazolonepropionase-like amidohydrolase
MATFNPALYFGITNTHGDIEKGKVADIVILNKNPVSDIRNTLDISMVIKSGRIFESNK